MTEAIHPKHLSLIDLLDKRLFTIPDYQRSYSWSKRQRQDLFDDIEDIWKEDEDSIHFMATVVCRRLRRVKLGTEQMTQLDIVDGQQRLTTLVILLNAIRFALADENEDGARRDAASLVDLLVKPHGDDLLLLQTNQDTSHFFSNYMRQGDAPEPDIAETIADRHLLSAVQECKSFVEFWPRDDRNLLDLLALVKNRLTFILHEIADEKTVYTVFEVLNSRGIDVSWLDRLKSILMGLAFKLEDNVTQNNLIRDLHRIWGDIYSTLGLRQGLSTEALRFAATLYQSTRPSKPLGEQDSVDELRKEATDAKNIRKVAEWLLKVTEACDEVKKDGRQDAVTRITQARLLAVALHARNFKNRVKREDLLTIWENVSFRIYGLYDRDARTGVGDYVRLAWDVINGGISEKDIRTRLLDIGSDYPIGNAINRLRGVNCYTDWTDDLRYLLFRYEQHLAKERRKKVDNVHWEAVWAKSASLSIEHIRPQSEAPDNIKHTLGNLMLLPPGRNSQLGSKSPHDKAKDYRETGFYQCGEVADMLEESGWTKKACEKREIKILDWARQEWAD